MDQTSFGLSGRFWPIRRPLFQGVFGRADNGIAVGMIASLIPTAPLPARADEAGKPIYPMTGFSLTPVDRARVPFLASDIINRHSSAVRRSAARDPKQSLIARNGNGEKCPRLWENAIV